MHKPGFFALLLCFSGGIAARAANAPSVEDFASRPLIEDVSISPDGRYLALIQTHNGRAAAVVVDRKAGPRHARAVMSEPEHVQMTWCDWATDTRLLCGFRGMALHGGAVYGFTRLAAVDADGEDLRVLMQNNAEAQGQFLDRIINWDPGLADTVLIEADEGLSSFQLLSNARIIGNVGTHGLPAVFELNVKTGALAIRQRARDPIRHWVTDRHGHVRLGYGFSGAMISYYARLEGESDWRQLTKFEIYSRESHFKPVAISDQDPNKAYAFGPFERRQALWLIDLTDKQDPTLVFSHPLVDVSQPVLARDGHLLGVLYETGRPMLYFTDDRIRRVLGAVPKLDPDEFSTVRGSTRDGSAYVIRTVTDADAPRFSVLDTGTHQLTRMESAYPDRDASMLAPMRPISYPARDGAQIPGYLTLPQGAPGTHLPLIVMPHGGPIARDTWGYFFLREFLASRGYAVLQMNFRGSSGYGEEWFFAAHQDWGGLTYDDVVDGARWAIQQGIADPARVGIVGWSFGGYIALVGAQRNPDLFRCAVDIAGVSDLRLLIDEQRASESIKKQIGTDSDKLKANSPRLHAAEFKVPLLMVHGQKDAQVPLAQSNEMDAALTRAGKPHRLAVVPEADHQFSGVKQRATLLHEIEAFLGEHLAVVDAN